MICSITLSFILCLWRLDVSLQWRHNGHDSVSNHQPRDCLLNHLFRRRSKKTSKLRVTGLCVGNSPWTSEFPAQMASNAENVSIWWRHQGVPRNQQHVSHGLTWGCGISNALATEMLQSCTKPLIWCMGYGLMSDWHQAIFTMTLFIPPWN